MVDKFINQAPLLDSPSGDAFAITPHADEDLATSTRGIYVGVTGNINLITVGGQTVLFENLPAGFILPVRAKRVLVSLTSATKLIGLA